MIKQKIKRFALNHILTREMFFFFGKRKANLRKIDRLLAKDNLSVSKKRAENVIVSLTTYGERIAELKYTLYSLIVQSVRSERIVVNIAFEDEKFITDELRKLEKYGVEFFFCKNTRSYTKLVPTLCRFPASCIVTCDDDVYYEKKWLQRLYETYKQYPNDVCSHRLRKITYTDGKVNAYQKWAYNYKSSKAERSNFLLGVSGVLYPPKVLHRDVTREDLFTNLAPLADDIWFYFMTILNGNCIRQVVKPLINMRFVNPYREYGISGGTTLMQQNVGQNKNDTQFKAILDYYKISEEEFIKFITSEITTIQITPPSTPLYNK